MDEYFKFWGEDLRLSSYSTEGDKHSTMNEEAGNNQVETDYTEQFTTDRIFRCREDLIKWARDIGRVLGFIVIIGNSTEGQFGERRKLILQCERSGQYRSLKTSSKSTGTKKCKCPFRLKGMNLKTGDDWKLKVMCGIHNHPAATYMEGHPYAGRLSQDETNIMIDMSHNLVQPRDILSTLKARDPQNVTTIKTIYNARQKHRVAEMAGRNQMQQLMHLLSQHEYISWYRSDNESNQVQDLFFAHPRSLDMLRAFPHILLMDSTYKTNRFHMPFFEIVGVTSTEMTFCVAFVFLQFEKEDNFAWALSCLKAAMDGCLSPRVVLTDRDLALMNAVGKVFPESNALLCKWHIGRNLAVNCKKQFEDKNTWDSFNSMWHYLEDSQTYEDYFIRLSSIEQLFQRYPKAINYIKTVWLDKYKEKFVAAWVNKSMHFGNRTTNRAESQHGKLKKYLQNSMGNLVSVWSQVHSLLEAQTTSIKASLEKSRNFVQHDFRSSIFMELRGSTSNAALYHILTEVKRSDKVGNDPNLCGCQIKLTHGLPCAHEISKYMMEDRPIPLSSIDSFWRKLDFKPTTSLEDDDINCSVEIELFTEKFKKQSRSNKFRLLQKLREIINPSSTLLAEPEVKKQSRGQQNTKKKVESNARRNSSGFQYAKANDSPVLQSRHSCSSTYIPQFSSSRRFSIDERMQSTFVDERMHSNSVYINQFPSHMHPYIISVTDVIADGNCGFRSVAVALHMEEGENAWTRVRYDMLTDLNNNADDYASLYGTWERFSFIRQSLTFFERYRSAPLAHWMSLPDMGHLIASCYNVVFIVLSELQSMTFLPLRSAPPPPQQQRIICIGHVNQNHFVEVSLVPNSPMPPIMLQWDTFRHQCAAQWSLIYELQFQDYLQIWNPLNVSQSTVYLDSD